MASTNKTSNYNLSQYVGTDKPTYLGDYNSDMSKIDAQMKANSEATSVVAGQVETIGQTATTALQNASTAQSTADNASSTANSALEKATANEASIALLNNIREFSTNEKAIGTWIDGKPLYRRVLSMSNTMIEGRTGSLIVGNIANLKAVTKIDATIRINNNVNFTNLPSITYGGHILNDSRYYNSIYVDLNANNDVKLQRQAGGYIETNVTVNEAYITVEYTKTTD